jgi:Cu/Ag efflux protein CusF
MRKYLIRAVTASSLIAVALAFTLPVQAQEKTESKPAKPKLQQFAGTIDLIDSKAGTITVTQKDKSETFKINEKTKYSTLDKKEAALTDFKAGDKVTVAFTSEPGQMIAHKISVSAEKKAKEKKE